MKRVILFGFIASQLLTVFARLGSAGKAPPMELSGRLGFGIASVDPDIASADEEWFRDHRLMKGGMDGALAFTMMFLDYLGASIELDFLSKGFRLRYDYFGTRLDARVAVTYLQIPIMATGRLAIKKDFPLVPYAQLGFAPAFRLAATYTAKSGNRTTEVDVKDQVKVAEGDFIMALGALYKLGPGSILLDLRFHLGMNNVMEDSASPDSATTRTFTITAGYAYRLPL